MAAAELFAEVGYESTSMASVARGAGVTTTTIYWYFEDKETLLVAVLDHLLQRTLAGLGDRDGESPIDLLMWVVDRLKELRRLVSTVHALAGSSPTVAVWHDAFHELTDALLAEGLRQEGTPEVRVPATTRLGVFAIEGLVMHPLPHDEQRAVLELLSTGH